MSKFAVAPLAALAIFASHPATAEVVEQSDDFFVTRDAVTVKTDPKATWLALITPAKWWNPAHTWSGDAANLSITPQGGACFCERIPERDTRREVGLAGSAQHMTVVQAAPMNVLRMRGGLGPLQSEPVEGVLTIAMQAVEGGGTRMVWEYVVGGHMRYEVPVIARAVDGVLSEQLGRLADMLGRAEPAAADPAAEQPAVPSGDAAEEPASVEDALDAMEAEKPAADGDDSGAAE